MAAPPVIHGHQMPVAWWKAAKRGATRHNTDPFRIAAVAWVECGGWKEGRLGKSLYHGPMGFNRNCNIPSQVLYSPEQQIEWAAGLLSGDLHQRLGRYNETPDKDNYRRDVIALARRLEWQARQLVYGW